MSSSPKTAFISGPLDVDLSYFTTYYQPLIDSAIASNHTFIIGPVSGIDTLALTYLTSLPISRSRISIYMTDWEAALHLPRLENLGVKLVILKDTLTTRERDAAMTRDSDYDVLRFRTQEESKMFYEGSWRMRVSNTEMNWRRRRGDGGEYVRHVARGKRDESGRGSWKKGEDGVEVCDGMCDGHRE
ncbi:hypothetical protein Slin15195_G125810 [Septoria linicola]|uniref:Uncharacterized protein n=1 Tax=Septoria linicola TaxID=215465 RepID=A0A9Q9B8I4_9PEZI|nr:hypothetical protein Slin14017_G081990 [Septoria linicola]USW59262.1 hypothetical protein Slin15195_G125810 [Septoria linicola]